LWRTFEKEDLEVLAEKLSTFEVVDSIYRFYGKSLVQMQKYAKDDYEERELQETRRNRSIESWKEKLERKKKKFKGKKN